MAQKILKAAKRKPTPEKAESFKVANCDLQMEKMRMSSEDVSKLSDLTIVTKGLEAYDSNVSYADINDAYDLDYWCQGYAKEYLCCCEKENHGWGPRTGKLLPARYQCIAHEFAERKPDDDGV